MKRQPLYKFYVKTWRWMVYWTRSCVLHVSLNGAASIGLGFSANGGIEHGQRKGQTVSANLSSCQIVRRGPESNGNTNLDGRMSDGGRECCTKRRMCDLNKGWHNMKWKVNHYINSMKKYHASIMVHFTRSCVLLGVLNRVANRGYGFSACGGG